MVGISEPHVLFRTRMLPFRTNSNRPYTDVDKKHRLFFTESHFRMYEKQRLAEVTAVKQRLSDSLRGVAKGVVKPVPQRDAMKVRAAPRVMSNFVGEPFDGGGGGDDRDSETALVQLQSATPPPCLSGLAKRQWKYDGMHVFVWGRHPSARASRHSRSFESEEMIRRDAQTK